MAEPVAIVLGEAPLMREAGLERRVGHRSAGEEALARRIQPKVTQVLHGRDLTVALETRLKRSHADAGRFCKLADRPVGVVAQPDSTLDPDVTSPASLQIPPAEPLLC